MTGTGERRDALETQLLLTRLLRSVDPQAGVAILTDLVRELGGRVAHADEAGPDAIPVDRSFGEGTPRVAVATHAPRNVRPSNGCCPTPSRTSASRSTDCAGSSAPRTTRCAIR